MTTKKNSLLDDAEALGAYIGRGQTDVSDSMSKAASDISDAFEAIVNQLDETHSVLAETVERLMKLEARMQLIDGEETS